MYLAMTDFRMYPYVQKERLKTAIGYFLKLVLFMSVLVGAFFTSSIFKELPTLIGVCDRTLPDFTIRDGKLEVEENLEREINREWYLVVNDEVDYTNLESYTFEEEKEHSYYLFVLSDTLLVAMRSEGELYEMGGIVYEKEMNLTKTEAINTLENFYGATSSRLMVWLASSFGSFLSLLLLRLWTLVMYILSIYIINIIFRLRLKWQNYIKIAIYVSTLPFLLEMIALIVVGGISESVNFISMLVSCVYIFYALRALKLDSVIVATTGNTTEEKIRNALEHAQQELERQLEEIEKEEKEKAERKKEEKEQKEAEEKAEKEQKEEEEQKEKKKEEK